MPPAQQDIFPESGEALGVLSRHWRTVRSLLEHNPTRAAQRALGFVANSKLPPGPSSHVPSSLNLLCSPGDDAWEGREWVASFKIAHSYGTCHALLWKPLETGVEKQCACLGLAGWCKGSRQVYLGPR